MIKEKSCNGMINSKQVTTNSSFLVGEKQTEIVPNEVNNLKTPTKYGNYLEVNQESCSSRYDSVYLNIERLSNIHNESMRSASKHLHCKHIHEKSHITPKSTSLVGSANSNQASYCCTSLNESAVASAKFSMLLSLILLLISVQVFFKSSGDDDTTLKMLVFGAGVYALCYLHSARKLMNGIEKEARNKFVEWIGFSILSVFLLFSGAVYIIVSSWDELKEIHNKPIHGCQNLALVITVVLIGFALIYCTRIVLLLWKSLQTENDSTVKRSCVQFINNLYNSCANSFNSFSRAVSH